MPIADTQPYHFSVLREDGSSDTLIGIYYSAQAEQAAPLALLLHGIPGAEKNHDLAQALRAAGWHAFVLHHAGCWGSGGRYNIVQQVDDARAALDYLLGAAAPLPIDPARVIAVGNSLGSRTAITCAALDERLRGVVSIAGFADFSEALIEDAFFEATAPFLAGVTAAEVAAQFRALGKADQPFDLATDLAPRPLLVIHGTADKVSPYYNAGAFRGGHVQHLYIEGAGHSFALHRAELIGVVLNFVQEHFA